MMYAAPDAAKVIWITGYNRGINRIHEILSTVSIEACT